MYTDIQNEIKEVSTRPISEERKKQLQLFTDYIQCKVNEHQPILLNFICTHNSRRSHLSQIWAKVMADYFSLTQVQSYSGGTEATAIYPQVLKTLEQQGFKVLQLSADENPVYALKYAEDALPIIGFSKAFHHPYNPSEKFCAVMTCTSADADCPYVSGADKRASLAFEDPKMYDGTEQMESEYLEKSREIASEMYWVFSQIQK